VEGQATLAPSALRREWEERARAEERQRAEAQALAEARAKGGRSATPPGAPDPGHLATEVKPAGAHAVGAGLGVAGKAGAGAGAGSTDDAPPFGAGDLAGRPPTPSAAVVGALAQSAAPPLTREDSPDPAPQRRPRAAPAKRLGSRSQSPARSRSRSRSRSLNAPATDAPPHPSEAALGVTAAPSHNVSPRPELTAGVESLRGLHVDLGELASAAEGSRLLHGERASVTHDGLALRPQPAGGLYTHYDRTASAF